MQHTGVAQTLLPFPSWLQRTAEQPRRQLPEQIITEITCTVEQRDGFAVKRCEEIRERFRLCADGQREMVESSSSTFIQPVDEAVALPSGRRDAIAEDYSSVAPVLSATLGQMLDDFFQYATELQHSLEQQGVDMSAVEDDSWHLPRPWQQQQPQQQQPQQADTSGSSSLGLFGWWQRKKNSRAAPAACDGQPSLQQLVRQSSSEMQEI